MASSTRPPSTRANATAPTMRRIFLSSGQSSRLTMCTRMAYFSSPSSWNKLSAA